MLKKILLSILVFLVIFVSFAPYFEAVAAPNPPPPTPVSSIQATAGVVGSQSDSNTNWYDQDFWNWYQKVYNPNNASEIFGERYTAAQVQWVIFGTFSQILHVAGPKATAAFVCITGSDIGNCVEAIGEAVKSFNLKSDSNTSPSKTALSFFDSQPLSGIGYVRQKLNNFHLIPEVNAQGTGFDAASPIQKLWVAFRNLTFGLMVIVVLIMAFMIMFRIKISPQVVITVQSALPKIAGALILITFSYAIAGFMIDIMYLVMGILASFLSSSSISTLSATDIFKTLNEGNIFQLTLGYLFYFLVGIMSAFAGLGGTNVLGNATGLIGGGILGIVLVIVAFVVLFFAFFKILWLLLKTYVNILLQIVLGPIQILLGTVTPFGGFGAWLKGLAGNLAVYPVVSFMYVLSYFFLAQGFSSMFPAGSMLFFPFPFGLVSGTLPTSTTWAPPMTIGSGSIGFLWLGASLVILTLIPKTAEIIQGVISGKPFAFGTGIGEAFGPVKVAGTYGAAEGMNYAQRTSPTGTIPAWVQTGRKILGIKS
ncbi:MAG: hypothetical protein Q8L28_01525 [bacterium]|nr:hypothetical protein [bacterium]